MALVKVTNRNNTVWIRDKYGGIPYLFPCGESTVIPEDAAAHIFGYGLTDKEKFKKLMRLGLANKKDGQRIFDNFVLKSTGRDVEPTGREREVTEAAPNVA